MLLSRDLVPPKNMVLAARVEGSGYYRFAERYRTLLARDGIAA